MKKLDYDHWFIRFLFENSPPLYVTTADILIGIFVKITMLLLMGVGGGLMLTGLLFGAFTYPKEFVLGTSSVLTTVMSVVLWLNRYDILSYVRQHSTRRIQVVRPSIYDSGE